MVEPRTVRVRVKQVHDPLRFCSGFLGWPEYTYRRVSGGGSTFRALRQQCEGVWLFFSFVSFCCFFFCFSFFFFFCFSFSVLAAVSFVLSLPLCISLFLFLFPTHLSPVSKFSSCAWRDKNENKWEMWRQSR